MRTKFSIYAFVAILLGFMSCSDSDKIDPIPSDGNVTITLDTDKLDITKFEHILITGTETNSNKEIKLEIRDITEQNFKIELRSGLYQLEITAKAQTSELIELKGYLHNLEVANKPVVATTKMRVVAVSSNFVIEEIYYTGSTYPNTAKTYIGDQYFKITNNSDEVLYADGLTIAESTFMTTNKYDYTPNFMDKKVAVQAIYKIPGNGKEYPIEPGKSIIIADKAIDHIKETGIPSTIDLSKADFEWYDESSIPRVQDTDNPDVPNLDKIYSYSRSIWIVSQQGNRAYLLLRMGTDTEDFLKNYEESYKYVHPAINKEISKNSYFVPNEWIIDAVNLSPKDKYVWIVTDTSLDAGYTQCGENSKDSNRYGKSVRRKVSHTNEKGRAVLQDTNNSSEDFSPTSTPSLSK